MLREHETSGEEKSIWEVIFPYVGVVVALIGVVLLLSAALVETRHPVAASVVRDVGLALLPIGVLSLLFEWLLRKHYTATIRTIVRNELMGSMTSFGQSMIESIVDSVIRKRQTFDVDSIKSVERMKALGLDKLLTRAELEVSDISFANVVRLLKEEQKEKEFLVVGKTLEFVSRQTHAIVEGLEHGVCFRFSLIDPTIYPWDPEYVKSYKERAKDSIKKVWNLIKNPESKWTGMLELRKTKNLVENSFSSFVNRGKRISVLDFDLGEDLNLQCSQVYLHRTGERNFAANLYVLNKDKFMSSQFVLSYPLRFRYAYVYGIRGKEILFVKKRGKDTWELPGGLVEAGEMVEETARREFLEETGHLLDIIQCFETTETEKLAFLGKVGNKVADYDKNEIDKIEFFGLDQIPTRTDLSYSYTGYSEFLAGIDRYIV